MGERAARETVTLRGRTERRMGRKRGPGGAGRGRSEGGLECETVRGREGTAGSVG